MLLVGVFLFLHVVDPLHSEQGLLGFKRGLPLRFLLSPGLYYTLSGVLNQRDVISNTTFNRH